MVLGNGDDDLTNWKNRVANRPLASNELAPGYSVTPRTMVSPGYKPITSPATGDRLEQLADKCRTAAKTIDRLRFSMADKLEQVNEHRRRFIREGYTQHLSLSDCRIERSGNQVSIRHVRGGLEGLPYISDVVHPELVAYVDALLRHLTPHDDTNTAVAKAALELNSLEQNTQTGTDNNG